jgi:hypothetical protein
MKNLFASSRTTALLMLAIAGLTLPTSVSAQQKNDFATHAFFKLLIGEWTSEGELKAADGNTTTVKEEWRGAVSGEGTFTIEGSRELNKDKHDYRWTIVQTATSGVYEVTHYVSINGGETMRFEASVSEVELTMERIAQLGNNTLKLRSSFSGTDRDNMLTKVSISDPGGKLTLSGTVTNKRVKK